MQQPCPKCGYISDRPTRFCRQCGTQLFAENEATTATTRQYAPQQSANSYDGPYQSQLAQAQAGPDGWSTSQPNSQFANQTPDTSRLYGAPAPQEYPGYPNQLANFQQAAAKKSSAWKWVLIALLFLALLGGGIGILVISAINRTRQAAQAVHDQVQEQIKKEIEQARQEAERAAENAGIPIPPQPPGPTAGGADLERYKYPGAALKDKVGVFGNEVMTMTTSDSVNKVKEYYKKQFGDPFIEDEEDDEEAAVFHIPGAPMTIITINKDDEAPDKTQITVVRSKLQIPKIN